MYIFKLLINCFFEKRNREATELLSYFLIHAAFLWFQINIYMHVHVALRLPKSTFNIVRDRRDIYMYTRLWKNKIDEDDTHHE